MPDFEKGNDTSLVSETPYHQACTHVQRFLQSRDSGIQICDLSIFEKPLRLKLSWKELQKFRCHFDLDEDEKKYPRYSYNSLFSALSIQCMPSPLREGVISTFNQGFFLAKNSLSKEYKPYVSPRTGEDFDGFNGKYMDSQKIADLAVKFRNDEGVLEIRFVLEIGFTEDYEDLVRDAQLWIEGAQTVTVCVIVQLLEDPVYKCPTTDILDEALQLMPVHHPKSSMFRLAPNRYGPAAYRGFNWTGELSAALVEVWRKNDEGKAYTDGKRMDILSSNPDLNFRLSDFMTIPDGQEDCPIDLDWGDWRKNLNDDLRVLALGRYRRVMRRFL